MLVTLFDDFAARVKREENLTIEGMADRVRHTSAPTKDELPWWKLAEFGSLPSSQGSLRWNGNVKRLTGVLGDYDGEQMSPDNAAEILDKAGIISMIYTSPSHTEAAPRWRVVCPFTNSVPPDDHYRMVARLNGVLGGILSVESFTLSQAYFYGSVAGRPGSRAIQIDGTATLERCDELDEIAVGKPNGGNGHPLPNADPEADITDIAAALQVIPNPIPKWQSKSDTWNEWNAIGMATWRASAGSQEGFEAWAAWSQKWPAKHDIEECEFRWRHFPRSPPSQIGFGTLVYLAREAQPGWGPPSRAKLPPKPAATIWVDDDEEEWTEAEIPPRPWIAPGYALRGAVTILAGPPSAMKSSLALAWAAALATGRPHSNFRPRAPGKCLVYNVEDDKTEQRRRLSAVLRQFDTLASDVRGKIVRAGPVAVGTLFARDPFTGAVTNMPTMNELRSLLATHLPDVLIVDPLAETHNAEENDNAAIRAILAEFRSLAVEFNIAVIILHHTRKGPIVAGDPDSARGASAIIGAARIVQTLTTMTQEDADRFGVPPQARRNYVRIDDAKQNYAAIGDTRWYEKATFELDNGEIVASAVPWSPPDPFAASGNYALNLILDHIDKGLPDGARYSDANAAQKRAAWKVITSQCPDITEKQARSMINTWVENGVLINREYKDPERRTATIGLFVNDPKRPGNNPVDY